MTAIDAIVSGAPTSAMTPNVSAVAQSATSSGTSRRRARKTSRSVSAMTSTAPSSRMIVEREIDFDSSCTTTGAPVTA